MTTLGKSITRIDAVGKVTGETPYPGDINFPGQLWMKVLFARRPHARVKRLDVSKAERAPGVVRVFTARDVPVNEFGLIFFDAPVLVGDIVRWVGEKVACVVAETEKQAAHALDLIEAEYEALPVTTDPREAMKPGARQIHPHYEGNIMRHIPIRKGDVARGFAQADVIVESAYHTPAQEHAYLQPEAGLGYIDEEGRITVLVAGQWTHEDQEQICHALGLTPEQVRVIYPAIGGAFGGREDMSVQIVLALAAWKLQRPVKIVWSREESIRYHHKRHPITITAKWRATKNGKITAVEYKVIGYAGGYAYTSTKVLGNATLMCTGPYVIPNAHVDTYAVYTNNIPTGAFRGFGGPQGAFAAESQMNKLAEALKMDPVELRLRNVLHDGDLLTVGTPLPQGLTIEEVITTCAANGGWKGSRSGWQKPARKEASAPHKRYGTGIAAAFKNVGFSFGFPEKCAATVELCGSAEIERLVLRHAGADVGQGAHTVMAQMAAEAAGVPLNRVELLMSDTATSESAGSASAWRMTLMFGNTIRGGVQEALKAWRNAERPAVGTFTYRPPKTSMYDPQTGKSEPNFAYGYVAEIVEVEVDLETGQIEVLNVICADDVGRAVNPQQVESQIEGAVVQAQGYAIMEDFQMREGRVLTPYLSNYLIPTILDVPHNVKSVIVEHPDPLGPWGARGMAEMPYLPFAPALTAAVHDAVGIWFDEIPLTPERVAMRILKGGKGG